MPFMNKVVLVTGAGSGIGEAIAKHFAKLSARLSLVDINKENLKKTAEACEKLSRTRVFTTVADLANDDHVKKFISNTAAEYGRIDVVINCVGIFGTKNILDSDLFDEFDRILNVNLRSIVCLTNAAASELAKTKGSIINISSTASTLAGNSLAYNVSKSALCHFTRCIALDFAKKDVRVNLITPGVVKTNILVNAGYNEDEAEGIWNKAPSFSALNKTVKAEEIAEVAAYLASEKAAGITGVDYKVDSGMSLIGVPPMPVA